MSGSRISPFACKTAALDAAAAAYLGALQALAPDKTRIVDKMPGNYLYLGLFGVLLPGAKIIHCFRDPRDTGLSIFTVRFYGDHGYAHDLADLGWTIGEHDRLIVARLAIGTPPWFSHSASIPLGYYGIVEDAIGVQLGTH